MKTQRLIVAVITALFIIFFVFNLKAQVTPSRVLKMEKEKELKLIIELTE